MKKQVAIFGGGIAGLWLLNRLRQKNIACVLIENNQLGSGQTIYSQGIIHSGAKYALHGKSTVSAEAMKEMPDIWRSCLKGEGEIDLSEVAVLSEYQYLWSPGSLAANLAVFLASKTVKGQISCLTKTDYPEAFATSNFKGVVYRLEEPVLAVQTLIDALATPHLADIWQAELNSVERNDEKMIMHLKHESTALDLEAEHVVLLAGKGNQYLAEKFSLTLPKMQCRPLLMVAVTAPNLPLLYAHAMQVSDKPRITITTHGEGEKTVWYLGGDLAETGVNRDPEQQIQFARQELKALFPHIDFSAAKFETFFIERAEAAYPSGKKPDGPSMFVEKNVITAWPTKLAFAPLLAQQIFDQLFSPGAQHASSLGTHPPVGPLPGGEKRVAAPGTANYPWSHD